MLVLLLCLCLFAWGALDLTQSRERDLQAIEQTGGTLTKLLYSHMQGAASKIDQQILVLVQHLQSVGVYSRPRAEIEAEMQRHLSRFPEAHVFRVTDAQGRYRYDASGVLSDVNISDRVYFIQLRDNPSAGLVISPPLVSRITKDLVIVFARRLQDRHGNFAGVVLLTLRAEYFENYYRSLDIGHHGVVALWSRDMSLFARWPQQALWQGRTLPDSPILSKLLAGETAGSFRRAAGLDGVDRVFVFRAVKDFPFVVSVGFSEHDVLALWRHRVLIYGLLGLALILALLALIQSWRRGYARAEALAEKMVRAFEEKSRQSAALLDAIPDPAWLQDNEGRYLAVNEAFCRYRNLPMDKVLGQTAENIFPPDEAQRLRGGPLDAYKTGVPVRQLVWLEMLGQRRPFELLRVPVHHDDGQPKGLAGAGWDMTYRFEAQERQRLITHFFDNASDAVLILDAERRVITMNKAATAISGYEPEDLQGKLPGFMVASGMASAQFATVAQALDDHGLWHGELAATRKDGSPLPIYCNISVIPADDGKVSNWAVFVKDLSERKAAEARIESLTHVDQLTELPNRQGFARVLGEWLMGGRSGVLIVTNLDQLSRINDAFGHEAGDAMLRRISFRLRKMLLEGDALGRLGGDQFGVLLALDNHHMSAESAARKLLDSIAKPVMIEGSNVVSTACAGICRLHDDGADVNSLLRNADAALHRAKISGHNTMRFFSADMNVRMAEHLRLESDLRGALARGELVLYYQPQVDLKNGTVVGFECLLRWHHPELGMVSPGRFIPLAETSLLILPIGAWVMEQACLQNKAWQDAGMPPKIVAVNLSAVQFHKTDVVATVLRALEVSGLAPSFLELEITESVIVEDPEHVVRIMEELKALGVVLSMDDFGTGYSSLSYLKRFPIDKIKIDRSFVQDFEHNANGAAIIRMIIGIAAELEHKVIAEGVETLEQLTLLQRLGCDEYQGFYCSAAVPADHIPDLVARAQSLVPSGG